MMLDEQTLGELETMTSAALHSRWIDLTAGPVPRVSPKLLRLALAWELQAKAAAGSGSKTTRMLDQLARGTAAPGPPRAVRLTREWRGRIHEVTVGEDQVIRWDGREWGSLSEVARTITGTRWSGPAFFGLKKKAA
jgi:hypothetical protein